MITLTLRPSDEPLTRIISHLYASFNRLREQKLWKEAVDGGASFMEITRGRHRRHWHVHLHLLVCGRYLAQRELSDAWRQASGGSYITDIRAVRDHERAASYVAKYASKGFSRDVVTDADALIESVIALRGRRVVGTFGCWRGTPLDGPPTEQVKWRTVGRLTEVLAAAQHREPWAIALSLQLKLDIARLYEPLKFADDG